MMPAGISLHRGQAGGRAHRADGGADVHDQVQGQGMAMAFPQTQTQPAACWITTPLTTP